jgi:hypothetical protein
VKIKVVAKKNASTTEQGNLLEQLASLFLQCRGFEVTENIQNTGVELDLLCTDKTNRAKKVYVECKAYDYNNPIPSDVIWKMKGIKEHKKYEEAWLVTTAPLGKQAKGVELEIQQMPDASSYSFYTPEKLVRALIDAGQITEYSFGKKEIIKIVGDEKKLGEYLLIITPYGNFWTTIYKSSGEPSGIMYTNAADGEIIYDEGLLDKLKKLDFGFSNCDPSIILELLQSTKDQIELEGLSKLRLNTDYHNEILDLGVKINHPHTNDFTLEDIYIFPDLEVTRQSNRKKVNSQTLISSSSREKYIIFGDELSGKTTLARLLQWRRSVRGIVTLVLNGGDIQTTSPSAIERVIEKAFRRQYGSAPGTLEALTKLNSNKKLINLIIDDFDKVSSKRPADRASLLNKLDEEYGDIYLFMNSSFEIEVMARGETKEQLSTYTDSGILQLGHLKRDELVTKWLQAGGNDSFSSNELLGIKSEILKKIEIAVGENFIPTNPFHLLTMLHVFEAGTKARTQGNSYADLYHFFIVQALVDVNIKQEDIHLYLSYLSHLAYQLFKDDVLLMGEADMKIKYEQFAVEMDINKDYDTIHNLLLRAKVLRFDEEVGYSFHLNYSRYYFVARYLANNIDNDEIKIIINNLIQNLHKTDAANIVVFLVHHSKNKAIIQEIITRAKQLFSNISMQALARNDLDRINSLIKNEMNFILQDGSPEENRRKELEKRDEYEDRNANEEKKQKNKEEDDLDIFTQVNLAFKTIDVLGQIANNYYGELDAKSKKEILDELYELGLRGLAGFMSSIEDYMDSLTQYLEERLNNNGDLNADELTQSINRTIYTFMHIVSFAFIKRISDSIASKNLLHTVDRVIGVRDEPAAQIVVLSAKLNFPNELNNQRRGIESLYKSLNKNYLPRDLLKVLVLQHIYKFEVSYKDKQSICASLGIDYSSLRQDGYLS